MNLTIPFPTHPTGHNRRLKPQMHRAATARPYPGAPCSCCHSSPPPPAYRPLSRHATRHWLYKEAISSHNHSFFGRSLALLSKPSNPITMFGNFISISRAPPRRTYNYFPAAGIINGQTVPIEVCLSKDAAGAELHDHVQLYCPGAKLLLFCNAELHGVAAGYHHVVR